ncbi:Uncharacterized protein TCM_036387 [Theobroma cacao]|uniref:Uncharacterized protein n=1 Tax=Theobroma cacao TaxID=3641 RepID=A0A061FRW0_THECC|nr:Uncharacterized protein TCM_036387 [Theobroma cacao]
MMSRQVNTLFLKQWLSSSTTIQVYHLNALCQSYLQCSISLETRNSVLCSISGVPESFYACPLALVWSFACGSTIYAMNISLLQVAKIMSALAPLELMVGDGVNT